MRVALTVTAFAVSAVTEIVLLHAVAFHEAGGWGPPKEAFAIFLLLAALPFALALLFVSRTRSIKPFRSLQIPPLLVGLVLGPFFIYCALAMYGHASPLFLLVALVSQCWAILLARPRSDRAN